jgi:hypothetical protein
MSVCVILTIQLLAALVAYQADPWFKTMMVSNDPTSRNYLGFYWLIGSLAKLKQPSLVFAHCKSFSLGPFHQELCIDRQA